MLGAVVVVVVGAVVGLCGYRLFHAALGVYGFVLGAALGLLLVGPLGSLLVGGFVAVVAGVLGAVAVSLFERAAFLLTGAAVGWLGGLALGALLGLGPLAWIVGVPLALVGASAGLVGERVGVTAGTAVAGAWLVVCGGAALGVGGPPDLQALPDLGFSGAAELLVVLLGTAFAVVQLSAERQTRGAPRPEAS